MTDTRFDKWVITGQSASFQRTGKNVELEIDGDDLEVRIDEGYGYSACNTVAWIPLDLLRKLLEGAP
jgi:hypothetical protein